MAKTIDRLYALLPAVYRERDATVGEPLRALLEIIEEQADLVEGDVRHLWDNFFVETCDSWVVPYLGDLVGTTPLFDASRVQEPATAAKLFPDLAGPRLTPEVALRNRADVAKTIYYRRRKGTLPMLEELARDVTGWGAHAVEFFELLGWTQAVRNHLRVQRHRTTDVRLVEELDRLNGPFDTIAHSVDVRPIRRPTGWYNIKNIGFFLWRLRSYEAERVDARPLGGPEDYRFFFSPLGNSAPLFSRWRREGDEAGLATELHVPGPIRAAALEDDLGRYQSVPSPRPGFTEFYGLFDVVAGSPLPQAPGSSFMIFHDGVPVDPEQIRCMNLSTWTQPTGALVGVDVRLGRVAFGKDWRLGKGVEVFYHYGFCADMGGGPYERSAWLVKPRFASLELVVDQSGESPGSFSSLSAALEEWVHRDKPNTVVRVLDNRTYHEAIEIEPADGRWLVIEAASGSRPHLQLIGPLEISGKHADASVTLSGLLVEGWIHVSGSLGRLRLLHSTLVPGRSIAESDLPAPPAPVEPSLVAEGGSADAPLNDRLRVEVTFSITGPLRVPEHAQGVWILDSIIGGGIRDGARIALGGPTTAESPGPPAWLERVTVIGRARLKSLPVASEVIFTDPVTVERRQEGCVRFSFVPVGSATPRRYRCQPDLEVGRRIEQATRRAPGIALTPVERERIRQEVQEWLVPLFTDPTYGHPAYGQLHPSCPEQIRTGAEDGSEMGALSHLKQPQREANLRLRLGEYLPFGLEPGLIYVT